MSGTSASLASEGGGVSLSQPVVRLGPGAPTVGAHDIAWAGGVDATTWDAIKGRSPRVWLYRYKRACHAAATQPPNPANRYDARRGYVHPADFGVINTGGRNVGAGVHNTRQGGTVPVRPTEWALTGPHKFDAVFNPELWFLDRSANQLTYPVVAVATSGPLDYANIGQSGQGNSNTGSFPRPDKAMFCESTRTLGTQVQWFAFAIAIQDDKDLRNWIVGPLSEPIRAEIWPSVKVGYGAYPPLADRGRKIRLRHA